MNLTSETVKQVFVIHLQGEIDASSCLILDSELETAIKNGEKRIIVRCAELDYISSAGLGVFTSYAQELENQNISLVLCELKENVLDVFSLLGLDAIIPIVKTFDEAMNRVNE
ncbi:MAG: STAS domain-containing protein [Cytophagales bacterium]